SLKRVEWEVTVAGQVHRGQAAAEPSQQHVFVWDGRDAYGRQVQGAQRINARIDYVYPALYREPGTSFATPSSTTTVIGDRTRGEIIFSSRLETASGLFIAPRADGLGAWTLDVQHTYDPVGRTLYRGDGTRRNLAALGAVITTIAGNGTFEYTGDGGPATAAGLPFASGLAVTA